jgi:hypothetical protein
VDCGLWLLIIALTGCAHAAPTSASGQLDRRISESSGLVESRAWPGVFWTHNDSGDSPRVFAVRANGALVREVAVEGAGNVDWEDIAVGEAGRLWLADTGNNGNDRRDLTVYGLPEPDPAGEGPVRADRVIHVSYPEQRGFPDPAARNFDAEALFWADGTLWLLTKHRSDLKTVLYRFPALQGDVSLERVQEFDLGGDPNRYGGSATAADLDPSGRYLALLSYHALFVFERPADGRSWLGQLVHRVDLDQGDLRQCEGVAWDGDAVLITNEEGRMFRIADPLHQARFPERTP